MIVRFGQNAKNALHDSDCIDRTYSSINDGLAQIPTENQFHHKVQKVVVFASRIQYRHDPFIVCEFYSLNHS